MKSLDFFNSIGPYLRILNVCRGRRFYDSTYGMHCACGLSFPYTTWLKDEGRWKFRCSVVWDEFVKLGTGEDADPQVEALVDSLRHEYGEDYTQWPKVGCGAKFRPWKNGPSRVVEMRQTTDNG